MRRPLADLVDLVAHPAATPAVLDAALACTNDVLVRLLVAGHPAATARARARAYRDVGAAPPTGAPTPAQVAAAFPLEPIPLLRMPLWPHPLTRAVARRTLADGGDTIGWWYWWMHLALGTAFPRTTRVLAAARALAHPREELTTHALALAAGHPRDAAAMAAGAVDPTDAQLLSAAAQPTPVAPGTLADPLTTTEALAVLMSATNADEVAASTLAGPATSFTLEAIARAATVSGHLRATAARRLPPGADLSVVGWSAPCTDLIVAITEHAARRRPVLSDPFTTGNGSHRHRLPPGLVGATLDVPDASPRSLAAIACHDQATPKQRARAAALLTHSPRPSEDLLALAGAGVHLPDRARAGAALPWQVGLDTAHSPAVRRLRDAALTSLLARADTPASAAALLALSAAPGFTGTLGDLSAATTAIAA